VYQAVHNLCLKVVQCVSLASLALPDRRRMPLVTLVFHGGDAFENGARMHETSDGLLLEGSEGVHVALERVEESLLEERSIRHHALLLLRALNQERYVQ
jgi:hypothetical protein